MVKPVILQYTSDSSLTRTELPMKPKLAMFFSIQLSYQIDRVSEPTLRLAYRRLEKAFL